MSEGVKYDQEKNQLGLLSSRWLFGVGRVLTFGAKKYAAHNWRKGIESSRLVDACLRHLLAWNNGEDLDPETGISHLYHASCCLMFLSELSETRPELDTRYQAEDKYKKPSTKWQCDRCGCFCPESNPGWELPGLLKRFCREECGQAYLSLPEQSATAQSS